MNEPKSKDRQAENQETSKFTVSDRRHWAHEDEEGNLDVEPEERLPSYVQQLKDQAEAKDKQLREYIAAYKAKTAETD
jgi:molecular chaperone GrpE